MSLLSLLSSAVIVAASSITPCRIESPQVGLVLVSVEEKTLDGGSTVRTYKYNLGDGILRFEKEEDCRNMARLPKGVCVPQKLDTLVCAPRMFHGPDGVLKMAVAGFRTGFCYSLESTDAGASWSLPRRMIHNPDKPFDVCDLPGGDVLLVKNCRIDEVEFTKDDELFACWSHDGGNTWYKTLKISGEKFIDNPVCCSDAEGNVYIAYRHYYQRECDIKLVRLGADGSRRRIPLLKARDAGRAYIESAGRILEPKSEWVEDKLRIVSYNTLRSSFTGGQPWVPRCKTICEHIEKWDPDFIGMQETSKEDIADLDRTLRKKYDYIAVTPEIMGPEVSRFRATSEIPIWWRKDRFKLLRKGWIEFNIINDVKCGVNVSDESWGNGQDGNKAAIWGVFLDKKSGEEVCVFNLHLPTRTEPSKLATAKMVAEKVLEVSDGRPVFITGDYNMDEKAYTFQYLQNDVEYIRDAGLAVAPEHRRNWEFASMGGDKPMEKKTKNSLHIDHIFYTPSNSEPLSWELETSHGSNGSHGSDHHPIMIEFRYAR